MKRPLLFIFGVIIAGEWSLGLLGIPLFKASPLYRMTENAESTVMTVSGRVVSRHKGGAGFSYVLTDVTAVHGEKKARAGDILVYAEKDAPDIGDRVSATGILSRFPLPSCPGQFHVRNYYLAQGIELRLTEKRRETAAREDGFVFARMVSRLREKALTVIEENAPAEDAGIFSAMLLGERSLMEDEITDLFKNAGISHILAVSGLHVSLIGMSVYMLLGRLMIPGTGKRRRAYSIIRVLASASFTVFYVIISGAAPSAARACVMFILLLAAGPLGRSYDLLSAMSAAGALILLRDPMMLGQDGFRLSFLAIFSIGTIMPVVYEWLRKAPGVLGGLAPAVSIYLMTLPVQLRMNGTVLPLSMLVNLLVIPPAGVVLVSAMAGTIWGLTGIPGAGFFFLPGRLVITCYKGIAEAAQGLPMSGIVFGSPGIIRCAVYYAVLMLFFGLLTHRHKRKRLESPEKYSRQKDRKAGALGLALTAAVCVFFTALMTPLPDRRFTVTALDVGQGDCFLVRADGRSFLIDAGSSTVDDAGRKRILPALKSLGVDRLSFLLLTHPDGDHINGAEAILTDPFIRTDVVFMSSAAEDTEEMAGIIRTAGEENIPVKTLAAGDAFRAGGVRFECIYPDTESEEYFAARDINETSLVMRMEYEGFSVLFTGDLGKEGEERLLKSGLLKSADMLKAGHHGSKNSTTEEFLAAAEPKTALISSGYHNIYGHPSEETLYRLRAAGCRYYCTAEEGTVTAVIEDGQAEFYGYLKERRE